MNIDDITEWSSAQETTDPDVVVVPDEKEGERVTEIPPIIPKPKPSDRFKEHLNRVRTARDKLPDRKPRRNVPRGPRTKVSGIISQVWAIGAEVAGRWSEPVMRVLTIQAPVAGEVLDDIVKDTVIDRLLQPVAKVSNGGEIAFGMLGPPIIVGLLAQNPERATVLVPLLRRALYSWMTIAGPKLKELQKKNENFAEEYGAEIDAMIGYFMTGIMDTGETPQNGNSSL